MKDIQAFVSKQVFGWTVAHVASILRVRTWRSMLRVAGDYSHPHGAGVIGPGADGLLRSALVEALTLAPGSVEVVMTEHDLTSLFGEMVDRLPRERFRSTLRVTESIEETIEYIEKRTNGARLLSSPDRTPILWMATPGADTDVVHDVLEERPNAILMGLFRGPWPYGPTHMIETDGPRPRPHRPVRLLTPSQAVARLHTIDPQR